MSAPIGYYSRYEWLNTYLVYKWYSNYGASFTVRIDNQPTKHVGVKYNWL